VAEKLEAPASVDGRGMVEAFERAIAREAHNLARRPDLLQQQLENRLQWEHDELRSILGARRPTQSARRRVAIRVKTQFRESRALIRTLKGHVGPVRDCAVAPDGGYIVSAGEDGVARTWDLGKGELIRSVQVASPRGFGSGPSELEGGAHCCAVSVDGSFAVCGGCNGAIKVWEPATGSELWSTSGSHFTVKACAVSPDGSRLLWATLAEGARRKAGVAMVWSLGAAEAQMAVQGCFGVASACAISPQGNLVAFGTEDGTIELWRSDTSARPLSIEAHATVSRAPTSLSGSTEEIRLAEKVNDCAFSPDGALLVSAGSDSTLRVRDSVQGRSVRTIEPNAGHLGTRTGYRSSVGAMATAFTACAVTPDGELILSGSRGGVITLWNASSGEELKTLEGHGDEITACAVTANGACLVSSSRDETLKVWDLEMARGG
jgi:WD40 repeat protein